jgi:hypothetical protein
LGDGVVDRGSSTRWRTASTSSSTHSSHAASDSVAEGVEGHKEGVGLYNEGVEVTGLLQDPHPHTDLGVATSFALL